MSASSLSIFIAFAMVLSAATQKTFSEQHSPAVISTDSSVNGDLISAYKYFKKAGSPSDYYDKTFVPLLKKYKSDIAARCTNDEKKLNEMLQVFLFSLNSCDETLPTILAETLSYRIDLFPDVMKHIPDKQKPEFLHMLSIGVANIEFETTKPVASQVDAARVLKFKAKFSEYQRAYPRAK